MGPSFFPLVLLNREMQFLDHHPLQTLLLSVSGGLCLWVMGAVGSVYPVRGEGDQLVM